MKKVIFIFGICTLSMLQTGCDNYEDLIPQEYNTILSLKQSGEQEILLNTTRDTVFNITVMKTGSMPDNEAHAEILPMSENHFKQYSESSGKDYRRLPDECFTIQGGTLDYSREERWETAKVVIHSGKTAEVMTTEFDYVTPILLTSKTDSVLSGKSELLLKVKKLNSGV